MYRQDLHPVKAGGCFTVMRVGETAKTALAEAGCYCFLEPVAAQVVDAALDRCPEATPLVDDDARRSMRDLCLRRLGMVYERPLLKLALGRAGGTSAPEMLRAACAVRDEAMVNDGASLRACLPLAIGYEQAIAANLADTLTELLERFLLRREEISRKLLGGCPITRLTGISEHGADPHSHGRMFTRVDTDAGSFFFKPHSCQLDALFGELAGKWLSDCVRIPRAILGEGYAFVERLEPGALADEEELCAYWRNLGYLSALFHSLGSSDMTQDNIMCCGTRPAALDLETLLTGRMELDAQAFSERIPPNSLAGTAILPIRMGTAFVSPLVADNASGACLPRMDGEPRTILGYGKVFPAGFSEGYLIRGSDDASLGSRKCMPRREPDPTTAARPSYVCNFSE